MQLLRVHYTKTLLCEIDKNTSSTVHVLYVEMAILFINRQNLY